jgi:uncharacterized repeat protein (TIGR01451 family)
MTAYRSARVVLPKRLTIGVVLGLVMGALALPVSASATGTLDQQQTSFAYFTFTWGPTFPLAPPATGKAQTFTAGRSGQLDQVDLVLRTFDDASSQPLRVEIRNASGDAPGSTVLASASLPAANVPHSPDDFALVAVPFASPATVLKDSQYAIVIEADGSDDYDIGGDQNTSYTGGRALYSTVPPGGNWAPFDPDFDLAFNTYVTPAADLSVSINGPATVSSKATATYLLTVHNAGPSTATNVVLTDNLPFGTQFSSVTPSQGTCTPPGKKGTAVTCHLGDIASGGSPSSGVTLKLTAKGPANLISVASVASDVTDPNTSNNTASFITKLTK